MQIARKGWKGSGEKDTTIYNKILKEKGPSKFVGYETLNSKSKVIAILKESRKGDVAVLEETESLNECESGEILLSETPFYAESGGQTGDLGTLKGPKGSLVVQEVLKPVEGFIVHQVRVSQGAVRVGEVVDAQVDETHRKHIMRHHTATHLLHAALRKILGTHVSQAGSLVSNEKLRFDFTCPRALTPDEILKIEKEVNAAILKNAPRKREELSLDEARKLGALAFFGEKYGSTVYVVNYGDLSTEVCGGTHCFSTGEIGFFKILSESSVASGVRRIEAVAGEKALDFVQDQLSILQTVCGRLKSSADQCVEKVEKLLSKQSKLEKEIQSLKMKGTQAGFSTIVSEAKTLPDGTRMIVKQLEFMDVPSLRQTAETLRDQLKSGIVFLACTDGEKVSFVVTLTSDCLEKKYHAGNIAKSFASKINGSGGGKESFAQGGGKSVPNLEELLNAFKI